MAEVARGEALKGLRIVWLQSPPWDGLWTRQNHFSRRFAADGAEILYVENPVSFGRRIGEGAGALTASVRRDVEPGLYVMSLPIQIPGSPKSGAIGKLNGARFASAVAKWMRREGWERPLYWCRLPISVEALDRLPPGPVVYDVTDDYAHYAGAEGERALTIAREDRLMRKAGRIFTTTAALAERLGAINPKVQVVPNGVDPSFFAPAPDGEADPLAQVARPRIGHIGLVASWMDLELLAKIAARWPGQLVSIGPVKPEVQAAYEAIPGLIRLPPVHNLELPRYLRALDVCIQPHLALEVRHRADPLKIVEYMAAGKPIVSTALRSLEPLRDVVELAGDHDQFLAAIERSLADADPALQTERVRRARERSWDDLYGSVRAAVTDLVSEDGGK
ncbi:glycosyltransferase [Sphingomonas sp. G-3-2-10]|uniref:glycosyltransferase n=1 Tax=Sphingomonas sp. G-3-2-10 TaxID=2728838 RepID=UPI00146DB43B|nr:glycosyltransferase [Sphingomonas sp. G-3-2-10]NML04461.1 glycosyltransferase family 1 protein [Sphingomonas sp. G-3-2-10]